MNRYDEMEDFIRQLGIAAKQLGDKFSKDTVYYHMTRGLIADEYKKSIKSYFPEWEKYFKNKGNINVLNPSWWKYFCVFENVKDSYYKSSNPIKMYISVDSTHIKKAAIELFSFLAKEDIHHDSKIGSEIRTDNIVIRVFNKNDAEKIANFIKNNRHIKAGRLNLNPFCFQNNGIGYAIDGNLSYNMVVSNYLCDYVKITLNENIKPTISGFTNYIENIMDNVFINNKGTNAYIDKFVEKRSSDFTFEEILNNYYEITLVLISALKGNDFSNYMNCYNYINDKDKLKERIEYFRLNLVNLEEKKKLFAEYVINMYKNYGYDLAYNLIMVYLQTGDVNKVKCDSDLKRRFIATMNPDECYDVLNGKDLNYYMEELNLKKTQTPMPALELQQTKSSDALSLSEKKVFLDKAILLTYIKYRLPKVEMALEIASINGNFGFFTNDNNIRHILRERLSSEDVRKIIDIYYNGDYKLYIEDITGETKDNDLAVSTGRKK